MSFEKIEAFIDAAHAKYYSGMNNIDGLFASSLRNLQIYADGTYEKKFGETSITRDKIAIKAGVGIALGLTAIELSREMIRNYQQSDDYLKLILDHVEKTSSGFKAEFYNDKVFKQSSASIASGYIVTVENEKINVELKAAQEKIQNDQEIENAKQAQIKKRIRDLKLNRYEQWFERISQTTFYKGLTFAWTTFSLTLALGFWIVSFISGRPPIGGKGINGLNNGLKFFVKFILPTIEPIAYSLFKLGSFIRSKIWDEKVALNSKQAAEQAQCEAHKQLLIANRLLALHYQKLENQLNDCDPVRSKEVSKLLDAVLNKYADKHIDKTIPNYIKRQLGQKRGHSRAVRIITSAINNFLNHFVIAFFSCVPILSLLIEVCGPGVVAVLSGNIPMIVMWSFSAFSSLVGLVVGGTKASIETKEDHFKATQAEQETVTKELVKQKLQNKKLRQLVSSQYQNILLKGGNLSSIHQFKPQMLALRIDHKDQIFRRNKLLPNAGFQAHALNFLDKCFDSILKIQAFFPVWTASFFNRSFFANMFLAAIGITAAMTPHGLVIGAICSVLFFVGNSLVNRYLKNRQARDRQCIADMQANLRVFEVENSYLKKLVVSQAVHLSADIKSQQAAGSSKNEFAKPVSRLQVVPNGKNIYQNLTKIGMYSNKPESSSSQRFEDHKTSRLRG